MKTKISLIATLLFPFMVTFCATSQEKEDNNPGIFARPNSVQPKIALISVFDNYQVNPQMQTAWGFGSVIQTPGGNILFDTGGNADILLSNMQKMGIEAESIDKVFISHIHGDHLGGLEGFLDRNNSVEVFIPACFPHSVSKMIQDKGARVSKLSGHEKISNFAWSTGELPGPPHEQALMIHSPKGLIVVTGCAHPGITKMVKKAKKLAGAERVYLVVGGFHHPPPSTIKAFRELGVEKVAPTHCTGNDIRKAFAREYGPDFIEYGVGKIISIH